MCMCVVSKSNGKRYKWGSPGTHVMPSQIQIDVEIYKRYKRYDKYNRYKRNISVPKCPKVEWLKLFTKRLLYKEKLLPLCCVN